jgi:colanic acid/amylovoran biosynthesis glycosyltransferase
VTIHSIELWAYPSSLSWKLAPAKFSVTISEYARQQLIEVLHLPLRPESVMVVHCGVDVKTLVPKEKGEGPLPSLYTIVFVGDLIECKGAQYLIEGCQLLRERGRAFQCLIIGEGPLHKLLEKQIASLGLTSSVSLLGRLDHPEVIRIVQTASCFVLPCIVDSRGQRDGIPVAIMEAMACEIPVISTPIAGIPELIDGGINGKLVPEKDPNALARAIEQLWTDPSLAERLGKKGRQKVIEAFNIHRSAQSLKDLFNA